MYVKVTLSFSVLTVIFLTWVNRCLLKQRMMEVVVTTGAISRAKLQSNHHHQHTNIQLQVTVLLVHCVKENVTTQT